MKRRPIAAVLLAGGLNLAIGACGDSASLPAPDAVASLVLDTRGVTTHKPGSTFVEAVTDITTRKSLRETLPLVNNQRSGGFEDPAAPIISEMPIRVVAQIAMTGRLPLSNLANDMACDTLRVDMSGISDRKAARIGVIALSDDPSDKVQINWASNANGEPADSLQVCFAGNSEPTDGVVLVLKR